MNFLSPFVFEIHARRWLLGLSRRAGRRVTLHDVPESELDGWSELGFTHVWLMGVWRFGFRARAVARSIPDLAAACGSLRAIGPSPYAVASYTVSAALGGDEGLASFRRRLRSRGMKLLLDFVPNHVGLDHPWIVQRPRLFVRASHAAPGFFAPNGQTFLLAHGKDPNFPPWADTVQLDYRLTEVHQAMTAELQSVARLCDGVRCDMSMLILSDVFDQTWREHPPVGGALAGGEFWPQAIAATRSRFPEFLFLAEVYWNKEARLQEMGFDYTYDKVLYDCLVRDEPERARRHLVSVVPAYVEHSAHFLENHDEPRIAHLLDQARHETAALLTFALPGMRFLHEGQLEGARTKLAVQALWAPTENSDQQIESFYRRLFAILRDEGQRTWELPTLEPTGAPNGSSTVVLLYSIANQPHLLVGVNLAIEPSSVRTRPSQAGERTRGKSLKCVLAAGNHQGLTAFRDASGEFYLSLPGRSGGVWRVVDT